MSSSSVQEPSYMAAAGGEGTSSSLITTKENIYSDPKKRKGRRRLTKWLNPGVLLPLAAGVIFLLLWELEMFHKLFDLKKYQLPLPSAIWEAMRENYSLLLSYTGYTLSEAVLGMLIGSACGFLIALAATAWPRWGGGSLTLVAALNAVPIVALAPIMNLWFGDGIGSRAAIVTATTMAAMAINAYKGMSAVDPLALDLMHSYAAGKPAVFRYLRIQNSLPYVFTALKINATASMIGAIVGEFSFPRGGWVICSPIPSRWPRCR